MNKILIIQKYTFAKFLNLFRWPYQSMGSSRAMMWSRKKYNTFSIVSYFLIFFIFRFKRYKKKHYYHIYLNYKKKCLHLQCTNMCFTSNPPIECAIQTMGLEPTPAFSKAFPSIRALSSVLLTPPQLDHSIIIVS